MRHHGGGVALRFPRGHPGVGRGERHDGGGRCPEFEGMVRRVPFHGGVRGHLQPVQPVEHLRREEVRQLLVLVEVLKRNKYNLHRLTEEMATSSSLNGIDTMERDPVPLLYQSGYLTIKGFNKRFRYYTLGFPNKEVEEGFVRFLLPRYASIRPGGLAFEIVHFVTEVRSGDIDGFMRRLQGFFVNTPYELARDLELHYQNVLFIVFKLLGFYTRAEYHTSQGRVDLVVQTDNYIYVMEFKLEGTAEEALRQINEKQYALPFTADPRRLYKIGVNFSAALRGIEKWVVE